MTSSPCSISSSIARDLAPIQKFSAKDVYFDLFSGEVGSAELTRAASFLAQRLEEAVCLDTDLPDDPRHLEEWMKAGVERVGRLYQEYLEERHGGERRRYFANKSHALYFLKCVAPTKLVDGAWLYGILGHWPDVRFASLIQTYLEELGEGRPSKNHVALYKKLLASQGHPRWDDLSDAHYVQGALQLAMGYNADRFLPEIIGFNLGYEQLPLHLLITAYELKELGIDPYYFTLHITVDNADSGHAHSAVQAIFHTLPVAGDMDVWYRRIRNGYNLNSLGASTLSVIEEFDIERELTTVFARKASFGQYAHSDRHRVEGHGVNEWLSQPDQIPEFMAAMERENWFKRNQDPRHSRFWKMIQSEKAKMHGVFSAYEQQIIYDWIAGNSEDDFPRDAKILARNARSGLSFEDKQRLLHASASTPDARRAGEPHCEMENDFDAEVHALELDLDSTAGSSQAMKTIIALMSPATHHTAAGLAATRIFNEIFN